MVNQFGGLRKSTNIFLEIALIKFFKQVQLKKEAFWLNTVTIHKTC